MVQQNAVAQKGYTYSTAALGDICRKLSNRWQIRESARCYDLICEVMPTVSPALPMELYIQPYPLFLLASNRARKLSGGPSALIYNPPRMVHLIAIKTVDTRGRHTRGNLHNLDPRRSDKEVNLIMKYVIIISVSR